MIDSIGQVRWKAALGRMGADSVTILLLQRENTALRQQGVTYKQLDSTRLQQIKLYADNEKSLRKQIKKGKVKQVLTGVLGIAIAVLAFILK